MVEPEPEPEAEAVVAAPDHLTRSEIINTFGDEVGAKLLDAGLASLLSVQRATDDELLAVTGIGPATLEVIREKAPYLEPEEDTEFDIPDPNPKPSAAPPDPSPRFGDTASLSVRQRRIVEAEMARKAAAPPPPPTPPAPDYWDDEVAIDPQDAQAEPEVVEEPPEPEVPPDEAPTEPLVLEDESEADAPTE
jgi:hypothetical protein